MQFVFRGPDPHHPLTKLSEQEAVNLCRDKLSGMAVHELLAKYHISTNTLYANWRAYKHIAMSQLENHEQRITTLEQTTTRVIHTPACISAHASIHEAYREMLSWEEHVLCGPYYHAETSQWLIMTPEQAAAYHAVAITHHTMIGKTK